MMNEQKKKDKRILSFCKDFLDKLEEILWLKYPSKKDASNQTTHFLTPLILVFSFGLILSGIASFYYLNFLYFSICFLVIDIVLIVVYRKSKKNVYLHDIQYVLTNKKIMEFKNQAFVKETYLSDIKTIDLIKVDHTLHNIIINKEQNYPQKTIQLFSSESYKNEYSKETFVLWHMEQAEDIVNTINTLRKDG